MFRYRNEIPHSVAGFSAIFACDSLAVIRVGMTTPETTQFDSLLFAIAGNSAGRLVVGRKRINLGAGSFVPVNPQQAGGSDEYRRVSDVYLVCVDPAFADETALSLLGRSHLELPNEPVALNPEIRSLVHAFITEAERGATASRLLQSSCGTALVGCLLRDSASSLLGMTQLSFRHGNLKSAIDYLHDNYRVDCRLSDIANAAHLSPFHLIRTFKAETGKTPHEYLVDLRVGAAKELLRGGEYSIKEIAFRCGFQEPGSFSRLFRERVGVSPREFRRAVLGIVRSAVFRVESGAPAAIGLEEPDALVADACKPG